jgi:protein-S-isoprenylcysteine O-methyltransferase Ste14
MLTSSTVSDPSGQNDKTDVAHEPTGPSTRHGLVAGLLYGLCAFLTTWAFWVYFIVFLGNLPKRSAPWIAPSADTGQGLADPFLASIIDLALIALFALQHSLMARPRIKALWASRLPPQFERATYVHAANLAAWLLVLLWQPIPIVLWHAPPGPLRDLSWVLFALGWLTLLAGALSFGVAELLGLSQIWRWCRKQRFQPLQLKTKGLYQWLRHPMYVGLLLGVWSAPYMTMGHVLLAAAFTLYILVALRYEERDLAHAYGAAYGHWRAGRFWYVPARPGEP